MKENFPMIRRKDSAERFTPTRASILENGRMTLKRAKESAHGRMEPTIMEIGLRTSILDLEKNPGPMEINILESGRTTESTAKEPTSGPMATDTKVLGMKESKVDKESSLGLQERNTLETSRTTFDRIPTDSSSGLMAIVTWDLSKITCDTDTESTNMPVEIAILEIGS